MEVKVNLKKHILEDKGLVNRTVIFSSFHLIMGIQNWHIASPFRQAPFPWQGTKGDDPRVNLEKHSDFSEHETNGKLYSDGVIP